MNLIVFDVPRLSVDIDLNYVGAEDRDGMLAERPKVEQAVQAVFAREGFTVRRMPEEHAGGKWSLRYESAPGRSGNLEVDINFMFRVPLWPVTTRDSHSVGTWRAIGIPVLVYGAMNRKDWRTVSADDVDFDAMELARQLLPTLRVNAAGVQAEQAEYGARLVRQCREGLSAVLPFTDPERQFLDLLLDRGVINPTLLTADESLDELAESIWMAKHKSSIYKARWCRESGSVHVVR